MKSIVKSNVKRTNALLHGLELEVGSGAVLGSSLAGGRAPFQADYALAVGSQLQGGKRQEAGVRTLCAGLRRDPKLLSARRLTLEKACLPRSK